MDKPKTLTLQQAAGIAGVSPDTIARWCKRYGIGKQLHSKAPWRVDPEGVAIVMTGDAEALAQYQRTFTAKMTEAEGKVVALPNQKATLATF